jgi:hypothetical protein
MHHIFSLKISHTVQYLLWMVTTVGGKSTGPLKTLCTVHCLPPPQHTEAQFKVPDWGDKVDFHNIIIIIIIIGTVS